MELDEADIAILRLLQQDSRRSMRDLAREAGISAPTAAARVRALEAKGVLLGYPASVAPEALGERQLFVLARAKPADAAKVARTLAARPEVRGVHLLGGGRVAAFATLHDAAAETELLSSFSKVPEISAVEVYPVVETQKSLPPAVVDRAVRLAVKCEFCGRRSRDEVVRVKVGEITHFVCCKSCKAGFLERVGRLAKIAGKARGRSDLPVVRS